MTFLRSSCEWCGAEVLSSGSAGGRPRKYCRRSHRQRAYEARRLAASLDLGPDDVLLDRSTWQTLRRALARLQQVTASAVEAGAGTADASLAEALGRLNAAVAELQESAEAKAAW